MSIKSMIRPHVKQDPSSATQIFSRPKTAQLSLKKIAEILEGKYMSIQTKPSSAMYPRSAQDNRKAHIVSQVQSRMSKRKTRNPSIDSCRQLREKEQILPLFEFENLKKGSMTKTETKQVNVQKQNNFVPYNLQGNFTVISQPSLPVKKPPLPKKLTDRKSEVAKEKKEETPTEVIESWRNEQQGMHFSSLFKKSWRF